jgi:sensor histidine kinase YesM
MPLHPNEIFSFQRNFPFIVTYIILICFFYANANYLTVKLISGKRYGLYIIGISISLVLYIYFHKYIISLFVQSGYLLPPQILIKEHMPLHGPDVRKEIPMIGQIALPLTQFLLFWVFSTCYRLVLEWLSANRKNKEIESEKSMIELAYLKAQINPHFIFNTLNTIYSLTINKSEKAPKAILLYSETVRYTLDKLDADFVSLKDEIDYIKYYIELQILRFTDSLNIEFETKGEVESYTIAPLIFISFIENAFQYGVSSHYPSTISIYIEATNGKIHFISKNKKYKDNRFQHIGKNIGIKNAQRKLNLTYPNHKLSINETEHSFCVDLLIYEPNIIKRQPDSL